MTALLLGILCYMTGHPVLGTICMIYAGLKMFFGFIGLLVKISKA